MEKIRPKLAVFDMDGVLTGNPSSWEFVHRSLGVDNTRNLNLYREGKISYIDFLKSDVRLWLDRFGEVKADSIIEILMKIPLRKGISGTVSSLASRGIVSAIVSGGIYWLAEKIGADSGFDEVYANRIKTDDSGNVLADGIVMVDPRRKDQRIREIQGRLGFSAEETISVGDTPQDVAMFRNSGFSISFNPVEETMTRSSSLTLKGNDLTAILEAIDEKYGT